MEVSSSAQTEWTHKIGLERFPEPLILVLQSLRADQKEEHLYARFQDRDSF